MKSLRFGPSLFYSCLKFERRHQMIKSFTKNSNFLNISKSIAEKYLARLELENCGIGEYTDHPILKLDSFVEFKGNSIKEIVINGTTIKNNPATIIMTKTKQLFCTANIVQSHDGISIIGRKLTGVEFSNELMRFQFDQIEIEESTIHLDNILPHVGHSFNFKCAKVVFFNKMIY